MFIKNRYGTIVNLDNVFSIYFGDMNNIIYFNNIETGNEDFNNNSCIFEYDNKEEYEIAKKILTTKVKAICLF